MSMKIPTITAKTPSSKDTNRKRKRPTTIRIMPTFRSGNAITVESIMAIVYLA
jgi:hypothetical protein